MVYLTANTQWKQHTGVALSAVVLAEAGTFHKSNLVYMIRHLMVEHTPAAVCRVAGLQGCRSDCRFFFCFVSPDCSIPDVHNLQLLCSMCSTSHFTPSSLPDELARADKCSLLCSGDGSASKSISSGGVAGAVIAGVVVVAVAAGVATWYIRRPSSASSRGFKPVFTSSNSGFAKFQEF